MPDPQDDNAAVLNIDSGVTLQGILLALEAYSRTIPETAVSKVTFEQIPNVADGGMWRAIVKLRCLGALERKEAPRQGEDFLSNVEPVVVHEQSWEAEGQGFYGAVEELRDVVKFHLEQLILQRQNDLLEANEALRVLRNPNEFDNMWSLHDNPEDEQPVEEAQ